MSKIVVNENLTLDGVMQAPGRPDEDPRDDFDHGGWATPYPDEVMGSAMADGIAKGGALLFGRRTYEQFASVWPNQPDDNPFTAVLNSRQKYVASTTLTEPLPWKNSTLLEGDAADAVAAAQGAAGQGHRRARQRRAGPVADAPRPRRRVRAADPPARPGRGSSALRRRRRVRDARLVDSVTTTTGVIIATYHPSTS